MRLSPELSASLEAFASQISVLPEPLGAPFSDPVARLGSELAVLSTTVANRERELNRLFDLIAIERSALLDAVLNRMFDSLSGVIPFDRVGCSFLAENGTATVAYWGRSTAATIEVPTGYTMPLADAAIHDMLLSGRPLIIEDLGDYVSRTPTADLFERLLAEGSRSSLTCPLVADGTPLGFLFFASAQPHAYTGAHASMFGRIAAQVSVVVQKTRAYGELVSHNRVLVNETRRLHQAATTDALTGVLNRRALDEALTGAWRRHRRGEGGFGIIIADVDRFKEINDTHGHITGDAVLSQAARRMERCLRGGDIFGRYGGEEFLAIVDTTLDTRLLDVAERLRARVARTPFGSLKVTASFGAAVANRFESLDDLVVAADQALYTAKHQGRDRCVLSTGDTGAVLVRGDAGPRRTRQRVNPSRTTRRA